MWTRALSLQFFLFSYLLEFLFWTDIEICVQHSFKKWSPGQSNLSCKTLEVHRGRCYLNMRPFHIAFIAPFINITQHRKTAGVVGCSIKTGGFLCGVYTYWTQCVWAWLLSTSWLCRIFHEGWHKETEGTRRGKPWPSSWGLPTSVTAHQTLLSQVSSFLIPFPVSRRTRDLPLASFAVASAAQWWNLPA